MSNHNPVKGLVHICGEHDVGKTTFAMSCGSRPKEIAFIDDDLKGQSLVEQIGADKFGFYSNFVKETEGMKELQVHQYGLELIKKLKAKNLDVIVWDTWTRFGRTFHPYVAKNPSQFKDFWSPKGDIKGGEQWVAAFGYEATVIEQLLESAPLVILITHLKDHRIGAVKTGKQVPDAQKTLTEKSNLRIWLRHNPNSAEPIGLVLKRIEKWQDTEFGLKPINVLPRKVVPCTWERILYYWENPIGNREPLESERPDEFELSILDETLTRDQKEIFKVGLREVEIETALELPIAVVDENIAKVKELSSQGMTKPLIAKELNLTIPQVIQYLSNGSKAQ